MEVAIFTQKKGLNRLWRHNYMWKTSCLPNDVIIIPAMLDHCAFYMDSEIDFGADTALHDINNQLYWLVSFIVDEWKVMEGDRPTA